MSGYSTYAIDASFLLESCLEQLNNLLVSIRTKKKCIDASNYLFEMQRSLTECKTFLLEYLDNRILEEKENFGREINNEFAHSSNADSLLEKATFLKQSNDLSRQLQKTRQVGYPGPTMQSISRLSDATDSLLFRLSVILQLCLVRIDDTRAILTGIRTKPRIHTRSNTIDPELMKHDVVGRCDTTAICSYSLIGTAYIAVFLRGKWNSDRRGVLSPTIPGFKTSSLLASTILQFSAIAFSVYWCDRKWITFWMSSKVQRSTRDIQTWNEQWKSSGSNNTLHGHSISRNNLEFDQIQVNSDVANAQLGSVEHMLLSTTKVS